jgi:hypothetical protein
MFVTDKLVYLPLQKTGGTHIVRMMSDLVGGESVGRKHGRLSKEFPLEGRSIVGSIRNPWSWYVSLWAFGCTNSGAIHANTTGHNLARHLSAPRIHSSAWWRELWRALVKPTAEWKRLYADSNDPSLFRSWLKRVFDPWHSRDLGENYANSTLHSFAGLLTYRYTLLFAADVESLFSPDGIRTLQALRDFDRRQNILHLIIRTESLEEDLITVLKSVGHQVDGQAVARVRTAPRTNTSRHRRTADYYDAETIDLVARREALIVEKYGYSPPSRLVTTESS